MFVLWLEITLIGKRTILPNTLDCSLYFIFYIIKKRNLMFVYCYEFLQIKISTTSVIYTPVKLTPIRVPNRIKGIVD